MSPRALTEQEKALQQERLLQCGKALILKNGMKKISVDDIARAVGIAKGSFYHYYKDKDSFLVDVFWKFHKEMFALAEEILKDSQQEELREKIEMILRSLLQKQEMVFFLKNHQELDLLFQSYYAFEGVSFKETEAEMFANIIKIAGLDPDVIKPEVVHNLVHAIFFTQGSEQMMKEGLDEAFDIQLSALLDYVFGGVK